jgi:hypothetical protein
MNTETLIESETAVCGRLRLFSLYVDFAAAVCARSVTSQITRLAGESWKSSTEMWNLDSLSASDPIRKMITQDAVNADVLIVAMSSLDRPEPELIRWLDSLLAGPADRPAPGWFIGLLGNEEPPEGELHWTVKEILRCARRMDRDFIWRCMEPESFNDCDWLAEGVELLLSRKRIAADAD